MDVGVTGSARERLGATQRIDLAALETDLRQDREWGLLDDWFSEIEVETLERLVEESEALDEPRRGDDQLLLITFVVVTLLAVLAHGLL